MMNLNRGSPWNSSIENRENPLNSSVNAWPRSKWGGKTTAVVEGPCSTTHHGDSSSARKVPLEGSTRYDGGVVHIGLWVLSLLVEEGICLPLVIWQESRPNFKGLPKVSGVATDHWVFLRCDWSPVSSWFYYRS